MRDRFVPPKLVFHALGAQSPHSQPGCGVIQQGGFKIEQMDTGYLAPFSKSGSYCSWGVAVPIAHQIGHALYMGFATHPGNGARSEVASRQGPPKAAWKGTPRFSGQVEKLDIQLRLAPLLFGAPKHPWVRFEGA